MHWLLVLRNRNSDLARMQMQPRLAPTRTVAVDIVADNRPSLRRRMHAQLMGATGDGFHGQPGQAVSTAEHFPIGNGLLSFGIRLLPPAPLGVQSAEREGDGARVRGRAAFDPGPSGLLHTFR